MGAVMSGLPGNQCPVSHPVIKKTLRIKKNKKQVCRALNLFITLLLFCFNYEHSLCMYCFFFGLGLGLLDCHPVLYTLHTVYVVGEFGGQFQFGCVADVVTQCNHILLTTFPKPS
jgi:hypothetical protein